MSVKTIKIDNNNFNSLIKSSISIIEQKDYQSRIYINNFDFDCWNGEDVNCLLSMNNSSGFFSGREDLSSSIVEIYDEDNNKIWQGFVKEIQRNYKSMLGKITCSSCLEKLLNQKVEYYETAGKTPALIAKEILQTYGLSDYIGYTFEWSNTLLNANSFNVKVYFNKEQNIFEVLNLLAKISNSDCYSTKNLIEFKTFDPSLDNIIKSIIIEEKYTADLKIYEDESNIINDYNIKLDLGVVSYTGSANETIQSQNKYGIRVLDNIDFSVQSAIRQDSIIVADWLGESYITRYKEPKKTIECIINKENFKHFLDLNMYVGFESSFEDLSNFIFEIVYIENSSDLFFKIKLKEIKKIT